MTEHCLTAFFDVNNNQMCPTCWRNCEVDKCVSQIDLRKWCARQALIVGQEPAVLATGVGWVGNIFYIFHLPFLMSCLLGDS